jgi:hypothetical protein
MENFYLRLQYISPILGLRSINGTNPRFRIEVE